MGITSRLRFFTILYSLVFAFIALFIVSGTFSEISDMINREYVVLSGLGITAYTNLTAYYDVLVACILSLLPSLYFINLGNRRALSLVFASICIVLISAFFILTKYTLMIPIFYFSAAFVIGTGAAILLKMVISSSQADFLRLAFAQFVSEDMLKDLMKNPDKLQLQGSEVDITVMFLDIRGFTTFSEHNQPVFVVHMLNDLLDKVTNIILDNGGTVDKYIGDAVMAFWGAPKHDKKQASKAVKTAIEIQEVITKETQFKVGVGINTGHAIVGNMGSTRRFDYTAIGDTVNTASRLESATKELGESIVMSRATILKLQEEKDETNVKDLGMIKLKGKADEVHAFGVHKELKH